MKKILLTSIICFLVFSWFNVSAQCNSGFSYVQQGPYTYNFTANQVEVDGYTYNYTWNFSNYGVFYTPTVSADFGVAGDFQVCLLVSIEDSLGTTICTDSTCQVVQSLAGASQCFSNVSLYFEQFAGSKQVGFVSNLNDYTNVGVTWAFGDGNWETGTASPGYTYASYGTYNVCLYLVDSLNQCVDTVCSLLTLDSCVASPNINWYQPVDGYDSIVFTIYADTGQLYTVIFGDGDTMAQTSSLVISHVYAAPGFYLACVSAGQNACQGPSCIAVFVDSCNWAAGFGYSYAGDGLFQLVFNAPGNFSNYDISSFYWYPGDGTVDSTDLQLWHTYPGAGTYIACFAANVNGCGLIEHCDTIALQCNLAATFTTGQTGTSTYEYIPDTIQTFAGLNYLWTFGDSASANTIHPVHVYTEAGEYNACLTVSDTFYGCTPVTYCENVPVTVWADTICGHVWVDANLNGIQDSGEANYQSFAVDVAVVQGNYYNQTIYTDSNGNYSAVIPVNTYLQVSADPSNIAQYIIPINPNGYSYTFFQDSMRQCGFDFGVVTNFGTITGLVYDDLNLDGFYDDSDEAIYNQVVDVNGQPAAICAGASGYRILEPPGTYNLSVDSSNYYYGSFPPIPAQLQATISNPGSLSSNNNFAIDVPTTYNDLGIDIIPTSPLAPGWNTTYFIAVTNYGPNNIDSVNFNFNASANLLFTYAFGGSGLLNNADFNEAVPGFSGASGIAQYEVLPSTPINTDIYDTATLIAYPDAIAANNIDTCHQITVSSFDPNNKLTTQSGYGPEGYISKDQTLKYVINFQNTGTSAAVNVVVRDVLDPNLDFSTFRFISAYAFGTTDIKISHDTLYFRLIGIDLPDSSVGGGSGSIGWIAYSIKPKTTVTPGTQIRNYADIFFDYNTPVRTNTTLHTIEGPTAITDIYTDGQLNIAPNPFGPQTNISLQNMPGDRYNYQVTDVLGRQAAQGVIRNNQTITLYRGTMTAGVYIISFYDDKGIVKRAKIVAQ